MEQYHPIQLLSKNTKTGCSIDLPIKGHCTPTKVCKKDCYGRFGHQSRPNATRKQAFMSKYLSGQDIGELIYECHYHTTVRLNGCGDLKQEHIPNVLKLANSCPQTQFWGMTRKPDIANAVNGKLDNLRLMVSVDSSSPKSTWEYQGAMCYGPRHPGEEVPEDDRIKIVFPRHFAGKVIKGVQHHPKDCLSVWDHRGCMACGRCWNVEHTTPKTNGITMRRK